MDKIRLHTLMVVRKKALSVEYSREQSPDWYMLEGAASSRAGYLGDFVINLQQPNNLL